MKAWKSVLAVAALSALGPFTTVDHAAQGCKAGDTTGLAVSGCANVWPVTAPGFRWPDLHGRCDPKFSLCRVTEYKPPQVLRSIDCAHPRVLEVRGYDHLARIRCSDTEPELFINLDSLSCSDHNAFRYANEIDGSVTAKLSEETGRLIVASAESRMKEMKAAVARDTKILVDLAERTDPRKLSESIYAAFRDIGELLEEVRKHEKLDVLCEPPNGMHLIGSARVRAQRSCRLLKVTFETGIGLLAAAKDGSALKRSISAACVAEQKSTPSDLLAIRMLLFYALKRDSSELPQQLRLIRRAVETGIQDPSEHHLKAGKPYFWELHSGFVFGGRRLLEESGEGYDCSDFLVASLVEGGREPEYLSTQIFKELAQFLAGEIEESDLPNEARAVVGCFSAVNLRNGDNPRPGDFVVSNSETMGNQHSAIVKNVLPDHTIVTIEAAGGVLNAILNKTRPLFEPVPGCPMSARSHADQMPVRPDIYVLRFKTPRMPDCPLDVKKAPG